MAQVWLISSTPSEANAKPPETRTAVTIWSSPEKLTSRESTMTRIDVVHGTHPKNVHAAVQEGGGRAAARGTLGDLRRAESGDRPKSFAALEIRESGVFLSVHPIRHSVIA